MTDNEVEFEFGVEFPTKSSSKSRTKESRPKTKLRQLPPIPDGAPQQLEQSSRYLNGRWQELFTYQCPSNHCKFIIRNCFNKDGALKTLDTHIRVDHRKKRRG